MWEMAAEDFDMLMKIAASIEDPELHVKFIIVSCVWLFLELRPKILQLLLPKIVGVWAFCVDAEYTVRQIAMNIPAALNEDEEISEIHLFMTHILLASAHSELHC